MSRPSLLALILLVSCAESTTPGRTAHYLVSSWSVVRDADDHALGNDLDGVASTGAGPTCVERVADHPSAYEPGVADVDNAFADMTILLGDPDGDGPCRTSPDWDCERIHAENAIGSGAWRTEIEIAGIQDLTDDPEVEVVVHYAARGAPLAPIARSIEASIRGGRLRARFDELPLRPHRVEADVLLGAPLRGAVLSADVTESALERGLLGGALSIDELERSAEESMPGLGDTVRSLLSNLADLDPDPARPDVCRSVSVGYGFEAAVRGAP